MLRITRSSFPACLRINSFQNYSAEVETRAQYVGGTPGVRDRIAEHRCPRAVAAMAPTLNALLRALPRPAPPASVYEAYRQLVARPFRRTGAPWTCSSPIWMFSCSRACHLPARSDQRELFRLDEADESDATEEETTGGRTTRVGRPRGGMRVAARIGEGLRREIERGRRPRVRVGEG